MDVFWIDPFDENKHVFNFSMSLKLIIILYSGGYDDVFSHIFGGGGGGLFGEYSQLYQCNH
jgi:hypothetical protein